MAATSLVVRPPVIKCPKCDKTFKRTTGLGSHMSKTHGVTGKSKSSVAGRQLAARRQSAANGSSPLRTFSPKLKRSVQSPVTLRPNQCPECQDQGKVEILKSAAGLGRHRRFTHGVLGKFAKIKKAHEQEIQEQENQEELGLQLLNSNQKRKHERNGSSSDSSTPAQAGFVTHEEALVIYAVGQIQGLCRSVAEQEGLSTGEFTFRCAEFILSSKSRRQLRHSM